MDVKPMPFQQFDRACEISREIHYLELVSELDRLRTALAEAQRKIEALRADRERLDFILKYYAVEVPNDDFFLPRWVETREDIDGAMIALTGRQK